MSKRLPVAPQGCPTSATEPPRSAPGASQHVSGGSQERPERLLDVLQSVPGSSREPLEWPEIISGPLWSYFGRKMHHFGWYFVTNFKRLGFFFCYGRLGHSTSICNLQVSPCVARADVRRNWPVQHTNNFAHTRLPTLSLPPPLTHLHKSRSSSQSVPDR